MKVKEEILNLYINKMIEHNSIEDIIKTISPLVRRKGITTKMIGIYLDEFFKNGQVELEDFPAENTFLLVDKFKKQLEDLKIEFRQFDNIFCKK